MIVHFHGIVQTGDDECRCRDEGIAGTIFIDGVDVVDYVANKSGLAGKRVSACILDERFDGELGATLGYGLSEVTPEESDALFLRNDQDLIERLRALEYQRVSFVIADEQVNILDLPPAIKPRPEDFARMAAMLLRDRKEPWFDVRPYVDQYQMVVELLQNQKEHERLLMKLAKEKVRAAHGKKAFVEADYSNPRTNLLRFLHAKAGREKIPIHDYRRLRDLTAKDFDSSTGKLRPDVHRNFAGDPEIMAAARAAHIATYHRRNQEKHKQLRAAERLRNALVQILPFGPPYLDTLKTPSLLAAYELVCAQEQKEDMCYLAPTGGLTRQAFAKYVNDSAVITAARKGIAAYKNAGLQNYHKRHNRRSGGNNSMPLWA